MNKEIYIAFIFKMLFFHGYSRYSFAKAAAYLSN